MTTALKLLQTHAALAPSGRWSHTQRIVSLTVKVPSQWLAAEVAVAGLRVVANVVPEIEPVAEPATRLHAYSFLGVVGDPNGHVPAGVESVALIVRVFLEVVNAAASPTVPVSVPVGFEFVVPPSPKAVLEITTDAPTTVAPPTAIFFSASRLSN